MTLDELIAGLTCREVLVRLGDYVDGELTADERGRIEGHLAACPNCAAFGGAYGAIATSLRQRLAAEVDDDVAARLAARLAQER